MIRLAFARATVLALVSLAAAVAQSEPLDFNRDVRPLLSDRCFKCHGFDQNARKAGLRLDTWEGMTAPHEGRVAVVPGDAAASELVRRTGSRDPAFTMPPPDSGLTLDDGERALLRRWVEEGAPFAPHWAFTAPREPAVPAVAEPARARNPIDRFVHATLEARGLEPGPEADAETLLRRIHLDLTGVPPTLDELASFLADSRPDAYERRVDALFGTPAHGERMALMWLDAARYADTNGFHHDNVRTAWPYRDWVIRAFQDNLPYDRFVVEQIAGDLFEAPSEAQQIATAFCRMHNINDEGGAIDAEYRVEAVCDRIETIATTFLGLTFTCARCHDHKYDPITQEDYYSLYAYFNSIDERGVYPNEFEQARAYPARLMFRPAGLKARVAAVERDLAAAEAELVAVRPQVERELLEWEQEFRRSRGVEFVDAVVESASARSGAAVETLADGSVRLKRAERESVTITLATTATDLRLLRVEALADPAAPRGRVGLADNGNAVITRIRAEASPAGDPTRVEEIELAWAWADHEQQNGDHDVGNALRDDALSWALQGHEREGSRTAMLFAARPFGFPGGTRVRVTIACDSRYADHVVARPRVTLARASVDLADTAPTVLGDWWSAGPFEGAEFDAAYDEAFGPESVAHVDPSQKFGKGGKSGWKHRPELADATVHALKGERSAFYFARSVRTPVARTLPIALGSDDAVRVFLDGVEVHANKVRRAVAPEQEKVELALAPGEHLLVVKIVNGGGPAGWWFRDASTSDAADALLPFALVPREQRDPAVSERLRDARGRRTPTFARIDARAVGLRADLAKLEAESVPVVVMSELEKPAATYVLTRGSYELPDQSRPVSRRPPAVLGLELPAGAPNDRLGFARWLVRSDHPLTARVFVNRIWQMLFGTGIVATPENFGMQSEWPSHPELLDWLAVRFVESGWDTRRLIRDIVTSATYRRSAVADPRASAVDPDNRLLATFPRVRLPGELVRDVALFVSGLLVDEVGGPSVRPYQPGDLWREVSIGASSNTGSFTRDDGEALYRKSLYTFWKRTAPNPQMSMFDVPTREFCVVARSVTNTPLQALVLWNDEQFVEAARGLAARTLAETGDDGARLERMFRRCTGRRPGASERAVLERTLAANLERYRRAPDDATKLIAVGESQPPSHLDAAELAAWTLLGSALLSLDETLVRD